jgi:regulator of protease activity HflC (stomatin/prohibitin superfamily)
MSSSKTKMKQIYLAIVGLSILCTSVCAQKINTDSLTLVSKISADQLKLGKLLNTVGDRTRTMQDDSARAQQSADDNKTAANRLSIDAQDKKLARQADKKASDAKSDARKARASKDKLDRLKRDIQDLQAKIADNQRRLNGYIESGRPLTVVAPTAPPSPSPNPFSPDTTRHL